MFRKIASLFLTALFLAGCTINSNWTIDVDLTEEEREKWEDTVVEFKEKIKNYQPGDEEFETPQAPIPYYIDLARAQDNLGRLGDALKTYQKAKKIYLHSQAIENNIGRLYEKAGEYEKAVEQYLYVAEEFQEPKYYYDITWVYIKTKDRKNAEKYFNVWQLATQKTDMQTQRAIKELREEEKAN